MDLFSNLGKKRKLSKLIKKLEKRGTLNFDERNVLANFVFMHYSNEKTEVEKIKGFFEEANILNIFPGKIGIKIARSYRRFVMERDFREKINHMAFDYVIPVIEGKYSFS